MTWLAVLGVLPRLWKLLTNPAVLVAAAIIAAFLYGRHVQAAKDDAAGLRAQIELAQRAEARSQKLAADQKAENDRLAGELADNKEKTDALAASISSGDACRFTDDERVRILRDLPVRP